MSSPRITCTAYPDTNVESGLSALANVYRFVLDCRAKKEAAPKSRPGDARKDQDAGTYPHCT
jgi:hypothetical protein